MDERGGDGLPAGLTADIAALAAVMVAHDLRELTVEANGVRVVLAAGSASPVFAVPLPTPTAVMGPESATPAPFAAPAVTANGATASTYEFRSPMIGTFYPAPGPTEEPYVRVGDRVTPGQTVAIIEAMKINNEIQIDRAGTVEEVFVSNGQPVEYNQPLLRLSLG